MSLRILALIAVRNEELHIAASLEALVADGIDVVILDHGSTDRTIDIAQRYLERGLRAIEPLAWRGVFSLSEQLREKARLAAMLPSDWVIHADADECLQPPPRFATLREGIETADASGYNCINFEEFVFAPRAAETFEQDDYRAKMSEYYFYAPDACRLMRAWKTSANVDNLETAGHCLSGARLDVYPENFILRHYIALSADHARRKYLSRIFADEDVAKGWHDNRRDILPSKLAIVDTSGLKRLRSPGDRNFDRSHPLRQHFWEW